MAPISEHRDSSTVAQSVLLYDSETWAITSNMLERLESFHRRIARRLTGPAPVLHWDTGVRRTPPLGIHCNKQVFTVCRNISLDDARPSVIFFAHKLWPPGGLLQYADRTTLLVTRFAIVIIRCVISEITPCHYRKPSVKCSYINNHSPVGLLQYGAL
jgi:hypothetical protein